MSTHVEEIIPDDIPRPVSVIGTDAVTDGFEHPPHMHRKAELALTLQGLIRFEVAKGLWMVPPECALWVPACMEHSARSISNVKLCLLFVDPDKVRTLPRECCSLAVSPLLRELVIEVSRLPRLYNPDGPNGRLIQTMLDRLITAPVERLHLPMPSDRRLRQIANAIMADPEDRATVAEWARRAGMSERTLFRLVPQETGMSFGRWRQQFHIMLALERLWEGDAVQSVAFDLGYESSSAFITMFRKVLGQPPAKYLAARRKQSSGGFPLTPGMVVD